MSRARPPVNLSGVYRLSPPASPEEEARRILSNYEDGPKSMPAILKVFQEQFGVLQTRTQMLLTLSTITLSITGFSGFRIREAGVLAQWLMASGLIFVVLSMVTIMLVSFRVRWVTQFCTEDYKEYVILIIKYRNWRTTMYVIELGLLLLGISLYSTSLLLFVLNHGAIQP